MNPEELKKLIAQINAKAPTFNGSIRAVEPAEGAKEDAPKKFELSFSSEDPYERWFGMEILGHKKGEVRLDWIGSGNAPLLLQHNHDQLIGIIESVKLAGGRGTAVVRFGKGALAQEIQNDVEDGIRRNVSVGYRIHDMKLVKQSDNAPDEYRVTDWEPHEVSIVSVPADRTVGTNRSKETETAKNVSPTTTKEKNMDPEKLKSLARKLGLNEDASLESVLEAQTRAAKAEAKAENDAELGRINAIRELAGTHRNRISDVDQRAETAVKDGISLDSFRREILDCYTNGTAVVRSASPASLSKQEKKDLSKYSFIKAIREKADGTLTGIEAEMHQEGLKEARETGVAVRGLSIPYGVLMSRDLTVATEGTDVVATGITGFIELLRNKMVLRQLGARVLSGLSGNIQIPKMTAGATAEWEGENDAGKEETQTIGQVSFSPNRVGCYTDISKQLLIQSTPDVEAMVRDDLATAIALAIDLAGINGSGLNDQPTGILNTSGIGSVVGGAAGLAPTWGHIVKLETEVSVDNADIGALSYLTNAKVRGKLKETPKVASTDSRMIWGEGAQPLNGYGCAVSNQVPSTLDKGGSTGVCSAIIFGNFNDLIIAQWGGLDLVVDPYTLATTNLLRIVANTYADVGVRHAQSFAAMKDALTA